MHETRWGTWLVPASKALASAERALGEAVRGGASQRLGRGLERLDVDERFDLVLVDCPPGMTPLTMNALVAAGSVLVPTQLDFLSVAGLAVLMETVEEVREYDNPALRYLGILGTQADERTRHAREIRDQLEELFGADKGDVRSGATHGSGLRHARAVSWVAALLTVRGRVWVSEHEFRHDEAWLVPVVWAANRGRHRPDLGVVMGASRVAVEVELSHKSPRRLQAILAGHEEAIASGRIAGGLIYVSDRADVLDAVKRAAPRAGVPERRFRTRSLSDIQAEVRRLTREQRLGANVPAAEIPADSRMPQASRIVVNRFHMT